MYNAQPDEESKTTFFEVVWVLPSTTSTSNGWGTAGRFLVYVRSKTSGMSLSKSKSLRKFVYAPLTLSRARAGLAPCCRGGEQKEIDYICGRVRMQCGPKGGAFDISRRYGYHTPTEVGSEGARGWIA